MADLPGFVASGSSLAELLRSDGMIDVVGVADTAARAMELLARHRPAIITVDVELKHISAYELTRRMMETYPIPVVIVSGHWSSDHVATTLAAMEAGAVAVATKPGEPGLEIAAVETMRAQSAEATRRLIQTVKTMSEVRVVRRRRRGEGGLPPQADRGWEPQTVPPPVSSTMSFRPREIGVVAIGASTGGPLALQTILSRIPRDFPAPLLIVQHIAPGFLPGLAEWLTTTTGFPVHVAARGDMLLPGQACLAPDGSHMGIGADGRIALRPPVVNGTPLASSPRLETANNGPCPSISHLFASVGQAFGARAIGVLLSGMGGDGAEELKLMRERGALTVVQDRESCVVYGMPARAIAIGAASSALAPDAIGILLADVVARNPKLETRNEVWSAAIARFRVSTDQRWNGE